MVVVMGVDEDEERRLDERPMHQGCMAGFLHLFDRPQILSGRRLHASPRRLLSSGSSVQGSATPSERSMALDRAATPAPSSPDMTPPAAPRPSLQLPPLDLKDGGAGGVAPPAWRLPRLSLDSRAVVDARGKLRPREIRTSPSPVGGAPPSPSAGGGDERRSPSVVARLMGLDALPHGHAPPGDGGGGLHSGAASPAALRRSASERVPPRDPSQSHFRFVDPAFFERPASPLPPTPPSQQQYPSRPAAAAPVAAEAVAVARRAQPDPACTRGAFQRRSRFDAHEVFPDPARRAADHGAGAGAGAGGGHGEIALYGEIERRLRKRGIAEPARDLETLKQILEALQMKGLLHHPPPPPPPVRTAPPPPIVVMRPSSRAPPQQVQQPPPARLMPARRLRVDVDRTRRPRSPDPSSPSPARSPESPARRGSPHSPHRRVSPAQSPRQQQPPPPPFRKQGGGGFDTAGARARIARRAAHNAAAVLSPDDEASTTFSDGGSSSSFSNSSRWDMEPADSRADRGLLERCGKLLSSIQAFTGGDAAGPDPQPSPVSVLDAAAFLADEDSPSSSSGSKRAIHFSTSSSSVVVGRLKPPPGSSDLEDDEWGPGSWSAVVGPEAVVADPDYAYVAELVRLFGGARGRGRRDPADVYKAAEELGASCPGGDTWPDRRLLCGAVGEALERQRAACPWEPAAWLRGAELVEHVLSEVRRRAAGEPAAAAVAREAEDEEDDLNGVTCGAIRRDMAADCGRWAPRSSRPEAAWVCGAEVAEAVLQVERLVFKDLVADTIRELADADRPLPRRKLVF